MNDIYRIGDIKCGAKGGMARIAVARKKLEAGGGVLVLAKFAANSGGTVSPTNFEAKMTVVKP